MMRSAFNAKSLPQYSFLPASRVLLVQQTNPLGITFAANAIAQERRILEFTERGGKRVFL
jgi:hypothetical protein